MFILHCLFQIRMIILRFVNKFCILIFDKLLNLTNPKRIWNEIELKIFNMHGFRIPIVKGSKLEG